MALSVSWSQPSYTAYGDAEAITVGASPFVWTNTNSFSTMVTFKGGTLSVIEYHQWMWAAGTYEDLVLATTVYLRPNDSVRVTYLVAPTMRWFPY